MANIHCSRPNATFHIVSAFTSFRLIPFIKKSLCNICYSSFQSSPCDFFLVSTFTVFCVSHDDAVSHDLQWEFHWSDFLTLPLISSRQEHGLEIWQDMAFQQCRLCSQRTCTLLRWFVLHFRVFIYTIYDTE